MPETLPEVTAIAAGLKHCLALTTDGNVKAWGNNDEGQCNVPKGLSNVARIYADNNCSVALTKDGFVKVWGNNNKGQCDVPEGLSGVVDIAIGSDTYAALKSNGTVVVWGDNYYGKCNVPSDLHDVAAVSIRRGVMAIKTDGTVVVWGNPRQSEVDYLTSLSNVLTISKDIIVFRDGTLQYYHSLNADEINARLDGLNVLSGHYFAINNVELLDPSGKSISSVASQAGYRIKAHLANNYASSTPGLTIIQVRAGTGAARTGGGQVLGCVGLFGEIPVEGSTVSTDLTMPAGLSGPAYVDVFLWDGWDSMVPRAEANQILSFNVTE